MPARLALAVSNRRSARRRPYTGTKLAQRRMPGVARCRAYTALATHIAKRVEEEAAFFNCSKSFVQVVAMATGLGIPLEPEDDYRRIRQGRGGKR